MPKFFLVFILFSCCFTSKISAQQEIDTVLLKELEQMVKVDQLAARNPFPPAEFNNLSQEQWNVKKDSIFRSNKKRAAEIFEEVGFPGFDIVGTKGSGYFFAIVQHSDFDPNFQKKILDAMLPEVKNQNANKRHFAFLTDRVKKNTGEKLVYGTQLDYHWFTGKAQPLPTIDPGNLNKRRAEIGLEPIEVYLDEMTETNNSYSQPMIKGITNLGLIFLIALALLVVLITFILSKRKRH